MRPSRISPVDNVVDVYTIGDRQSFSEWFYAWRNRWLAGEAIRVLLANDGSHALVIADPDAPRPGRVYTDVQLQLL